MTPTRRYKQGDNVMVNGFPGVIVRHYADRMYEVRLKAGVCCVDMTDQEGKPENEHKGDRP
jgi:hypothetical protein